MISLRLSLLIIPTTRRVLPYFLNDMTFSGKIGIVFNPWGKILVIKSQLALNVAGQLLHLPCRVAEKAVASIPESSG